MARKHAAARRDRKEETPSADGVETIGADAARTALLDFVRALAREAARADHEAQVRGEPLM